MITRVIKRDQRKAPFSERRIREAISEAMRASGVTTYKKIEGILSEVVNEIKKVDDGNKDYITVEEIQDIIIKTLKKLGYANVAANYQEYRENRTKNREMKSDVMCAIKKIGRETSRDNANVGNNFSSKLLQIASVGNKWSNLADMPKEYSKAHEEGDIHIHDLDSYNLTVNCLNLETGKILNRGFNTGYGSISEPNSIEAAGELSCILLQSTQNDMFGGQAHVNFDNDMAIYVHKTRLKIEREYSELLKSLNGGYTKYNRGVAQDNTEEFKQAVEEKLEARVRQAMQGVVYNLNTMHSRAGSQVPFSSVNLGIPLSKDAALVCRIFLEEYDKGMAKGEQMIFPNIIFRVKKGVNYYENDPYRYLYDLAVKVAAHRMNPTFKLLDSPESLYLYNEGILAATMGCRTSTSLNINGSDDPAGRGNIAPVSINIPRLSILSKGNFEKFMSLLDKKMDLCEGQLIHRYGVLKELKVRDLPFVAGEKLMKGSENLGPDDSIEPILKQGTWAIGFIGIAEAMKFMFGKHHGESEEVYKKATEVLEFMSDKIKDMKERRKLNFSLYATPAEGLSGRFVAIDKKKFGVIEGVTDKGYYTNSYHIPVEYNISAIRKADLEAPFHQLCTGGHISYFEIDGDDRQSKENYIKRHIAYCVENTVIDYVAYNFRIRYCRDCGEEATMDMTKCSRCGSDNFQGVSRVTGYMSLDERFGPGKVAEREARIIHK